MKRKKLNELRYNNKDFNALDEGDAIIVFKGNVYPLYLNDNSEENINYLVNLINLLCNTFTELRSTFFEENGKLRDMYMTDNHFRLFDAMFNFNERPSLLFGEIVNYDGYYAIEFDNTSNYDIQNSKEFNDLLKTEIVDNFTYIIINGNALNVDELKKNISSYNNKEKHIAPTLYHGTCLDFINSILKYGLRQKKENSNFKVENTGFVFLTSVFDIADRYADMYAHDKRSTRAIIKINSNKINKNNIVLDYDFAMQYTSDETPFKRTNSDRFVGNVAKNSKSNGTRYAKIGYKGIIMPNAIEGVYVMENGSYKFYDKQDFINMNHNIQTESKLHLNEWKPSFFDELPDKIKLYHGTDIYALEDIISDEEINAANGKQHGETKGVNWFSLKNQDNFNRGVLFSIEVPKEDFLNHKFEFMNNSEVTSAYGYSVPIYQYNFKIEKIGGYDNEVFNNIWKRSNYDIFEFVKIIENTNSEFKKIYCIIENPVIMYLIRQLFGDDVLRKEGFLESINHLNEMSTDNISLKSFEPKKELNPKFWVNDKLNSRVRLRLLDIADDFIDELSISWVKPKDIVLTGSIANYNWSKYSDVDVHIVIDYSDVHKNKEFVENYFSAKKDNWSNNHEDLKIYGFPVELYVEDENAKSYSNGVYSLNKNEWIKEPKDIQDVKLNETYVKNYCAKLMTQIENLEKKLNNETDNHKILTIGKKIKTIFDKLKSIRKEGLKTNGEMSSGNIIWKLFRRMGYLDKMWDIIYTTYNKANSLKESKINEDYYKNSMTDSTTWFDGEPTEPAKYGGKWIHVEPLKGWERIGVIDDSRNKNKILYVFGNPNAEQTENFQQFKERNLSLNKDENGKDGYNHFYIDTRYCKVVLYPQYENSYYDVAINDGNNKQYKLKKHQELMSKLFLVNVSGQNKIILQHDSSYCITDGVVKKGKTNPWSNNSDFGCYFWASRNIGADPSNGQQYTYFCVVDADKCYDTEYNPDNYKTDKEVYDKYDYWFKELNGGVACQTASQTPIWCVRDNKTGQFYDKEWNVIQKPPTLN